MSALISIITPCYNKGNYLDEAIESVLAIKTPYSYEFIIVDDGSTDEMTIKKFDELEAKGYTIIHQQNMGPAGARNTALEHAQGKYILPLDADNKINKPYLITAIDIIERDDNIDVVFGNSFFFGEENFYNRIKPFDIKAMMEGNYIDTCAVIRKTMLDKTNGYDTNISRGHEDWELWINIFFKGGVFHYLDEPCFQYRVSDNSMRFTAAPNTKADRDYIFLKNADALFDFYLDNKWRIDYLKKNKMKGAINILLGKVFD